MPAPLVRTTPTVQHKKFVKNVAGGMKLNQAALSAGFSADYGKFLKKQPMIQSMLQKALDDVGINDKYIARGLKQGTKAYCQPRFKGDTSKYPDFFTRRLYYDHICKVRGDFAPDKLEIEHKKITLVISPQLTTGLLDSRTITEDEAGYIEAEIIKETKEELSGNN